MLGFFVRGGAASTCGRGAESGRGLRILTGADPGAAAGAGEAQGLDGPDVAEIAGEGLGAGEGL
jgi:hypothetical protein